MSISARRRTAKVVLALAILGGLAIAGNSALLAPTADGGLPGPIITGTTKPGWPAITTTTIDNTK
jgi:hypothetical protein